MLRVLWLVIILTGIILILQGCGVHPHGHERTKHYTVKYCSVDEYTDHVAITCPDGTYQVVKPSDAEQEEGKEQIVIINECYVISNQDADNRNNTKQDVDVKSTNRQDQDADSQSNAKQDTDSNPGTKPKGKK